MPPRIKKFPLPDPEHGWSIFVRSRLAFTKGVSPRDTIRAAHTQQALDAELSAIHLAMCDVKARRNALSTISALPDEVLIYIFEFARATCRPASDASHRLGWITVTHVCRHWRDTAVDAPCLWNDISSGRLNNQWTDLMLARTREIPITICWNLNEDEYCDYWDLHMLSPHVHRARHLTLRGSAAKLVSLLSSRSFFNAVLKTLDLDGCWRTPDDQDIAPELPATMIGTRLPSLSEVYLAGLCIPWSAPILCELTHLEIYMPWPARSDTTWFCESYRNSSYDEFLCALERMPALRVLVLEYCLPMNSAPATRKVALPQIQRLNLHDASKPCFAIFQQLIVPPTCQLLLDITDEREAEDIAALLPALAAHFSTQSISPPFRTLRIYSPRAGRYTLEAWRPSSAGPDLSIALPASARTQPATALLALCAALLLHAVQALVVTPANAHTPLFTPAAWRAFLARCPAVSQARLTGPDAFALCGALAPPFASDPESQRAVNTTIAHLCIEGADFTGASDVDGVRRWHRDLVARWLLLRREVAPPARLLPVALSLVDCVVSLEGAAELEGVASVRWYTSGGGTVVEHVGGGGDGDDEVEGDEDQDQDDEHQSNNEDEEGGDLEDEAQDDEVQNVDGEGGDPDEYGTDEDQDDRSESGYSTEAVSGEDVDRYIHVELENDQGDEDEDESSSSDEDEEDEDEDSDVDDDPRLHGGKW